MKKISLTALVLLVVSAIDSIRNLPSTALFGSSLIFFFFLSAIVFLLPTALISAELSSSIENKGGIYHWTAAAFGEKIGMLAIWLQWINTMVWYPTILSFLAGTLAYLIYPPLLANTYYLIGVVLGTFWLLTFVNLFGIRVSTKLNGFCCLVGTMMPMVFLILLGAFWVIMGNPINISFDLAHIVPNFHDIENWISLTVIMASFLGIELAGVHINDIEDPQVNFPKAMGYAAFFLIATMLLGSLSIAMIIPPEDINLVSGVMQVFEQFFRAYNLEQLTPLLALLILIGSFGSIINWLISPAKGLLHAAEFGFLPPLFSKRNQYDVPQNVLITQAVIVTAICLTFILVPSVNAFYWFLTALSTDLAMVMYILMFFSAIKLKNQLQQKQAKFCIPGGTKGVVAVAVAGIIGCLLTIVASFFPPSHIHVSGYYFAALIFFGNIIFISPVALFYGYKMLADR